MPPDESNSDTYTHADDTTYETPSKYKADNDQSTGTILVTDEKSNNQNEDQSSPSSQPDDSVNSDDESKDPPANQGEDSYSSEDKDAYPFEGKCMKCNSEKSQCHKKPFTLYCIDAVEREFRYNPLDITRKRCNTVFTLAYNKAYDFRHFQLFLHLPPNAFYYPPACMKSELNEFMAVLENDQKAYFNGQMKFQSEIEVNTLDELNSQIESYCSAYEIPEGNKTAIKYELDICDDCGKSCYRCHYRLFGEYCYAHVHRMFDLYSVPMTKEATKMVYLKWYNSALHFLTWEMTGVYLKKFVVLPPRCLE